MKLPENTKLIPDLQVYAVPCRATVMFDVHVLAVSPQDARDVMKKRDPSDALTISDDSIEFDDDHMALFVDIINSSIEYDARPAPIEGDDLEYDITDHPDFDVNEHTERSEVAKGIPDPDIVTE